MIRLEIHPMDTVEDIRQALQKAIELELSTLPPYLYALFSIQEGTNEPAKTRISAIVIEEMTHMALACNILNAIGGSPVLAKASIVPEYPGPLPYDIGGDDGEPFLVSLLPFSKKAMKQAIHIEEPEDPLVFSKAAALAASFQTIGQFYAALDKALGSLPAEAWANPTGSQITDYPFLAGELFPVVDYPSASEAIGRIVSEGEGTTTSPLDFEGEVAHFYRFEEIRRNQLLQKDPSKEEGFSWGEPLGVDWDGVVPVIRDPAEHDFSGDPAGQAAQDSCDRAFTVLLQELERAVTGEPGRMGNAVRAMFDLRMAARAAVQTPLKDRKKSAGPAFRFRPELV